MNKFIAIISLTLLSQFVNAQRPAWYTAKFKALKLDLQYSLATFAKPSYQQADFNGDGVKDVAALIIQKRTKKKGILLIEGNSDRYFVFGAGTKVGKPNFDESDRLDWMDRWKVDKAMVAYETTFDKDGDILGSAKVKTPYGGLSIWQSEDGSPLAGGLIYWTGKKYACIHQCE
ncbi:hypothetical protein [Mucilaginibacter myungsuensis]|uniref:VCBS repeat protein n=1 Tax=Mucilaginibacter myungsuensis TaxID=649104 RepID=A0A929PVR3_9SPHI|nr:hypothetical protein [Mucilaginibacter myungsuensis]MBE9661296.1 hypothetical protein [Mucilaginibacter myungsuensis]MDN3597439.1 hypothetical protein [Mucilaginibacter myungsuensis]